MESLDALDKSLSSLEEVLAPLFDTSLTDTVGKLELLQKAKLQVLLPYVVHDLVFIYLKTRGINPKTHPVVGELDRIKQYFDKIKNAEDPEKRRFAVDQGAATRFIKHAIKESQAIQEQAQKNLKQGTHTRFTEASNTAESSQSTVVIPRATDAALAKIQAREAALQQGGSSSEESELEVFTDDIPTMPIEDSTRNISGKGKSKMAPDASLKTKRRRAMDPWTGHDEKGSEASSAPEAKRNRKRSKQDNAHAAVKDDSEIPQTQAKDADTGMEVEVRTDDKQDIQQPEGQSGSPIDKSNEGEVVEVIEVDASPMKTSNTQGSSRPHTAQVIDVDAIDSSRSGTPAQEKKKKRKKKKGTVA